MNGIYQKLKSLGLGNAVELLEKHKQKSVIFEETDEEKQFSKLGGKPDLPATVSWPKNSNGESIAFLGQIDFAEVAKLNVESTCPKLGFLWFFYDAESMPWDGENNGFNFYFSESKLSELSIRNFPDDLAETSQFIEKVIHFNENEKIPYWDIELDNEDESFELDGESCTESDFYNLTLDELDDELEEEEDGAPIHKLFGLADTVQSENDLEDNDDILLLQLSSDDDLNWCWGDAGRLYFRMSKQDLINKNFTDISMNLECY